MGSPGGVSIVHFCVTGSPLPNSVTLLCIQYRQLEKVSADHMWLRRGSLRTQVVQKGPGLRLRVNRKKLRVLLPCQCTKSI